MTATAVHKYALNDYVETSKGERCIIRYIGAVDKCNIEMIGVEFIDGTIGEHDGSIKGKRYFTGTANRCSFIKYNKIRRKTKPMQHHPPHHAKHSRPSFKLKNGKSARNRTVLSACTKSMTSLTNKRRSLPTQLSEFNHSRKTQHQSHTNIARRSSDSSKNKSQYLMHLRNVNHSGHQKSRAITSKSQTRQRAMKKMKKNGMRVICDGDHDRKRQSQPGSGQRSRKSNDFGERKQPLCHANTEDQSTSTQRKANKDKCCMARSESSDATKEPLLRRHQSRVHLSQMDVLALVDPSQLMLGSDYEESTDDEEENKEVSSLASPELRRNASSHITLSQRSLNQYHLKRNVVVGDLHIGHRYRLKDGRVGICLYIGPLHHMLMNNGNHVDIVENEYIGIALEKGEGDHDGEIRGKRYFSCGRRCGIFVKRNLLRKDCGPADEQDIENLTTRKRISRSLYDGDSDISDLSDIENHGDCQQYDAMMLHIDQEYGDDAAHSGHSDVGSEDQPLETNERISVDSLDTMEERKHDDREQDIASYIDLFSPPAQQLQLAISPLSSEHDRDDEEQVIIPMRWHSDHENERALDDPPPEHKEKQKRKETQKSCKETKVHSMFRQKTKTKIKRKASSRQSRSISLDKATSNSRRGTNMTMTPKRGSHSPRKTSSVRDRIKNYESKAIQRKVDSVKTAKKAKAKKRSTRASTVDSVSSEVLVELDKMSGVAKRIKPKKTMKAKRSEQRESEEGDQRLQITVSSPPSSNQLRPTLAVSISETSTQFPFVCDSPRFDESRICKIDIDEKSTHSTDGREATRIAKRSRRNATPIVSIPRLVGETEFNALVRQMKEEDVKQESSQSQAQKAVHRNNDFYINLSSKALTPINRGHSSTKK